MGWLSSNKTIGKTVSSKIAAGKPHGGGPASKVQARQAKQRKAEIKAELARKKQEAKDIKRYKRLHNNQTDPAKIRKQNAKAIAAGEKRRAKKEAKRAERRARGFWGLGEDHATVR